MPVCKDCMHHSVKIMNDPKLRETDCLMQVSDLPYGTIIDWSNGLGQNYCILAYRDQSSAVAISLHNPGCTYSLTPKHKVWVVGWAKSIKIELHS